jgi:hypothetical protein
LTIAPWYVHDGVWIDGDCFLVLLGSSSLRRRTEFEIEVLRRRQQRNSSETVTGEIRPAGENGHAIYPVNTTLQRAPVSTSIHVDYTAKLNRPEARHGDSCLNELIRGDFVVLLGAVSGMIRAIFFSKSISIFRSELASFSFDCITKM